MIDLTLQPPRRRVRAGDQDRVMVTMHNPTLDAGDYLLEVQGLPANWYTLTPLRLAVPAHGLAQAALTVHPPASAGAADLPFTVVATGVTDPSAGTQGEGLLQVETPLAAPAGEAGARSSRRLLLLAGLALVLACAGIAAAVVLHRGGRQSALPACPTAAKGRSCGRAATTIVTSSPTARVATPRPTASPTRITPRPTAGPTFLGSRPTAVRPTLHYRSSLLGSPMRPPGRFRLHRLVTPRHVPVATLSTTVTPTPATPTARPTSSDTGTASASPTATATATETATATNSATVTTTPSLTNTGTATLSPSPSPTATRSATPTVTTTSTLGPTATVTRTPTPIPTPGELGLRFGYVLTAAHFTLNWSTTNAGTFQIDGLTMPTHGTHAYPLSTHTFVLEVISPDGSQTKIAVAALTVLDGCRAHVNESTVVIPGGACRGTATLGRTPIMSPTPVSTGSPTPSPTPSRVTGATPLSTRSRGSGTPTAGTAQATATPR